MLEVRNKKIGKNKNTMPQTNKYAVCVCACHPHKVNINENCRIDLNTQPFTVNLLSGLCNALNVHANRPALLVCITARTVYCKHCLTRASHRYQAQSAHFWRNIGFFFVSIECSKTKEVYLEQHTFNVESEKNTEMYFVVFLVDAGEYVVIPKNWLIMPVEEWIRIVN